MRTYSPKASEIQRAWHVIDAEGLVLGRLCTEVARVLRGKHKPIFAPHLDTGDHVIVINAARSCSPRARRTATWCYRYSGYPGGLKAESLRQPAGPQARGGHPPIGEGHAAEGPARPPDGEEAQDLRRPQHPHGPRQNGPTSPDLPHRRCPLSTREEHRVQAARPDHRSPQGSGRPGPPPPGHRHDLGQRPHLQGLLPSATPRMVLVEPLRVPRPRSGLRHRRARSMAGASGPGGRAATRHRPGADRSIPRSCPALKKAGLLTLDAPRRSHEVRAQEARKAARASTRTAALSPDRRLRVTEVRHRWRRGASPTPS